MVRAPTRGVVSRAVATGWKLVCVSVDIQTFNMAEPSRPGQIKDDCENSDALFYMFITRGALFNICHDLFKFD